MKMMRLTRVWTTNVAALLLGFGMYSAFVLIPQFVQTPTSTGYGFGASVSQAGLFLVPTTLALLITSPIGGRLSNAVGSKVPLVLGSILTTIAFGVLATAGSRWEIYVAATLVGAGVGFAFASMANLIVEAVPREQTGVATGMNTIVRTIGGAIGAEIAASVLAGHPSLERRAGEARLHAHLLHLRRRARGRRARLAHGSRPQARLHAAARARSGCRNRLEEGSMTRDGHGHPPRRDRGRGPARPRPRVPRCVFEP
jgi:MFS family permease